MPLHPAKTDAQRMRAILDPLTFRERGAEEAELTAFFEHLRAGLPPAADAAAGSPGEIQVCLAQRAEAIQAAFGGFYRERRGELERSSLAAGHAYGILHGHTRLVDALHRFAFEFALEDLLPLLKMRCSEWATELTFTRTQLEQKVRQIAEFATQTAAADVEPGDTPSQRAYYRDIEAGLGQEHAALEVRIAALEAKLSAGRTFRLDRRSVERRLAAFARGGYGRAELGFASDLDTGYCIDGRGLAPGESEPLRELILRMEALLRGAGLETVHQYFEIGEDLSRFARPEAQHTITSVLEGRALVGSAALLRELQEQFRGLVGFERFAARKLEEFRSQHVPSLSAMDLKEDAGGLRSIQIPLWLAGLAHEAESYSMAGLLALAHREGLLTPGEAERLAQALELLHDLRNGIAVQPPAPNSAAPNVAIWGGEARNSGAAHSNLLDAAAKARYVEGKRRFATVDDLERYRLRLVDDVRRLSHKLAGKVLDRTVVRRAGSLDVTVHLKSGTITALTPAALTPRGGPPSGLAELLREERCLLGLFEFVAETGYRFADEIRERLAELVPGAVPARGDGTREARAQAFWRIMNGPSAHRAMEEFFAVNRPGRDGTQTLIGRFVPACDRLYFLAPEDARSALAVHLRMTGGLAKGQRRLEWFRDAYPEWAPFLNERHVQGLRWSLFFQEVGHAEPGGTVPARRAELAAEALMALGLRDETVEGLVRLLVEHRQALVELTRSAAYDDQALAEYFELAGRDLVQAILLFLMNLATLESDPGSREGDAEALLRFFDEAMKILAGLRVIPSSERTLELINVYLDGHKQETERDARLFALVNRILAKGLTAALYAPLQRMGGGEWQRIAGEAAVLDALCERILVERQPPAERERLVAQLAHAVRGYVSGTTLSELTREEAISWYFAAFPNRYLLRTPPRQLAAQMAQFGAFGSVPVLVDAVTGKTGERDGLLIAVRGLAQPHVRVAYALALKRVNILSGKVNRVLFEDGTIGYCYYFQVSTSQMDSDWNPRDIEQLILEETQPPMVQAASADSAPQNATRVNYLGDDRKGYRVQWEDGAYVRKALPYRRLRVVRRDEPFLFYRLCRLFDRQGVELQQALITTTGNQVGDYFYLLPADAERLRKSRFERDLIANLDGGAAAAGSSAG
ncbi:MAG: hypothetical protein V3T00_03965 [bacterium]